MTEFNKETTTTHGNSAETGADVSVKRESTEIKNDATGSQTAGKLIYYFFGVVEILLAFRLILKLMGASAGSGFVSGIYSIAGIFIAPFQGIFQRITTQGAETTSVFEPATLVAIIVYVLIAWGIVKLIQIFSGEKE